METNKELKAEVILVGFLSNGEKSILTVGTPQLGGTSEIINAFQGEAAIALYETLKGSNPKAREEDEKDVRDEKNDMPGTAGDRATGLSK